MKEFWKQNCSALWKKAALERTERSLKSVLQSFTGLTSAVDPELHLLAKKNFLKK